MLSDASCSNASREHIDIEEYARRNCEQLPEILSKFNIEKING